MCCEALGKSLPSGDPQCPTLQNEGLAVVETKFPETLTFAVLEIISAPNSSLPSPPTRTHSYHTGKSRKNTLGELSGWLHGRQCGCQQGWRAGRPGRAPAAAMASPGLLGAGRLRGCARPAIAPYMAIPGLRRPRGTGSECRHLLPPQVCLGFCGLRLVTEEFLNGSSELTKMKMSP